MFNKVHKSVAAVAVAAIAISTVAAVPSYAVDFDPGATAIVTPTGDWLELTPNESHLYQFNFDYIEDDGTVISEAIIELEMGAEDSVSFEVYTPTEVAHWANGEDLDSIGAGAKLSQFTGNDNHDTRLIWANRAEGSDLYYVVVENNRSDIASYYEIDISGAGVSFPQVVQDVADVAVEANDEILEEALGITVEGVATAADEETVALIGGVGPFDAIAPTEGTVTLDAGETRWYTFDYDYDDSDSPSEAIALLEMVIPDSVSFEIWNHDTVREWANGDEYNAVGAGTPIEIQNDDKDSEYNLSSLQWVGSSKASSQYFIVVENETEQAATFSLSVTGEDVNF